jgi:hypothetical protein
VPCTVHVDLAQPDRPFAPWSDWPAGFGAAHHAFEASLLAPDLEAGYARLRRAAFDLDEPVATEVWQAVREAALRVWAGEAETMSRRDVAAALRRRATIPPPMKDRLLALLDESPAGAG